MIDPVQVREFLAYRRIAVFGASDDPEKFGGTIYRQLIEHGYDAAPVNPNTATVADKACYPDLDSVPGHVDGAIVVVNRDKAAGVVQDCIDRGVPRVWLFKGLGGASAVSEEALELCRRHGIDVIAGACPLMFLEPVAGVHRFHRALRRINGSLAKAS